MTSAPVGPEKKVFAKGVKAGYTYIQINKSTMVLTTRDHGWSRKAVLVEGRPV
jgi:hypothetical protein